MYVGMCVIETLKLYLAIISVSQTPFPSTVCIVSIALHKKDLSSKGLFIYYVIIFQEGPNTPSPPLSSTSPKI